MKKLIILLLSCVLLSGCSNPFNDAASKEDIFAFVNEHYEELEKGYSAPLVDSFVTGDGYYHDGFNIKEFACGSEGVFQTAYSVGFYYSKNNNPYSFYSSSEEFVETSPGIFEYHTTKKYEKAERIRENWFWYERSWS